MKTDIEIAQEKKPVHIKKIAEKLGITWGGSWKTPDTPHFEIDENWQMPKEENNMDEILELKNEIAELKKRISVLENKMVYNYIDKNIGCK